MVEALAFVGLLGAVAVTLGTIWKALRLIFRLDRALPILLDMAEKFTPDHGESLHDRIVRTDHKVQALDDRLDTVEKKVLHG